MTQNFKPAVPKDLQSVLHVFAVASRVVCTYPEDFDHVTKQLEALQNKLISPEVTAARECDKLWRVFAKVALLPKPHLVEEAAKAFYRDLDSIGQRLDLPPLEEWDQLPTVLNDPKGIDWHEEHLTSQPAQTLANLRNNAADIVKSLKKNENFPAEKVAEWILQMDVVEQRHMFNELVGKGLMSKAEVNLLARCLIKGGEIAKEDTALIDVFNRLGKWLSGT